MLFGLFLTIASICFSAFQPVAQAASLSTLNFQARLQTNPGGGIVPDGNYNIEFKLYNASSSSGSSQGSCTGDANCLWTETWYDSNGVTAGNDNRVRVAHGYLTVNLGSLTSFPSTINWDQSLYITMNIGGSTQTATPTWNGEMSPRLALTAVPYAFKAGQLATFNSGTGFTSTLALLQPTVGNQVFQIQDHAAAGTYTILDSANGFLQGGNSFGATAVLGANDANALQFKAGNAVVTTFTSAANIAYFGNASTAGTAATPTNFTLNGTGSSTAGTSGGKLTIKGGAGATSTTGSDGGDVSLLGGTASGTNARVGGQITITGGTPSATGAGGAINLTTGAGGTTSGGSGALSLQTGTTTSGTTGSISLTTGNATTGTAGNINLDVGTSSTGAGSINIGTTNGTSVAKTITIGHTAQTGTITLGQSTATNTINIGNAAVTGTQTIAIGTGATGAGIETISLGSTLNTSGTTVSGGSNGITLNTNGSSAGTLVKSTTTNSTAAFQVQNAAGDAVFKIDTNNAYNYISNYSFETNSTGWAQTGGATVTRETSAGNSYHLSNNLAVDTTGTGQGARVSGFTSAPSNAISPSWNFSFYIAVNAGGNFSSSLSVGYDIGGGDVTCTPSNTSVTSSLGYTRVSCFISLTSGQTISSLFVKQTDGVTRTFHLDAVQMYPGSSNPQVFQPATAKLNGTLTSPLSIVPVGSGEALSVYNSNGQTQVFSVNPTTNIVNVASNLAINNVVAMFQNAGGAALSNITGYSQTSGTFAIDSSSIAANSSGTTIFKRTGAGAAGSFQIQNGSSDPIFSVDTSGNQVVLGKAGASGLAGKLVFQNSANAFTTTLTTSTSASANYTLTLPTALSGVSGDCLKDTNGTGQLGFAACGSGLSGFGTIDSVGKSSTNGASISGNNIILQSADASNPGLVTFSGTQIFGGNKTFNGDTLVKDTSTAAFTVQDSGATNNLIIADTTNSKLSLGTVGSNSLVQLTGVAGGAGSLQAFATNAQSLGGNRVGSSTVTANGYMYVLGGYDGTTYQSTVYYAKINADGSTGAFTTTAAMQAGRAFGSAVVGNNGYIYYLGGTANGTTAQATVYYSKIQSDGTLGTWATDATHPVTGARIGHTSITANGYIYVIGGWDGTTYQATTYYAKMAGDGTVGAWATTTSFAAGRAYHSTTVVNGFVYVIGGTANGTAGNNTIYYASINTAGTLNAWSTEATNTLPAVRMGATSVLANGYTYVLGGSTNNTTGAANTVYYAKFNANGSVGTWSTNTNNLINTSYQHSSIVANGYVYIIAGWDGTTRRAAVYYASGARLQVAASIDLIGSTQTNGSSEEQGNDMLDGSGSSGGSIAAGNIFSNGSVQITGGVQIGGALVLGSTISGAGLSDCSGVTSKLLWSASTQQFSCGNDRGSTLVVKSANETTLFGIQDDDELLFAIPASETWIFEIDASINAATGSGNDFNFQVTAPTGASCSINGAGLDGGSSPTITNINDIGCAVTTTVVMGGTGYLNVYGSVTTGATAGSVKFRWANSTVGQSAGVDHGSLLRAYRVGPGADYAENYFTKDINMTAGDVVSVDGSLPAGVQKSSRAYQHDAIGVVSTKPGQVIGDDVGISQGRPVAIALNGRVPVKIASDSPEIKAGDLITASAQAGRAMKATRAGQIIGKALTDWKPDMNNDTIVMFMNVSWGDPNDDTVADTTATGVTIAQQAGGTQLASGTDAPKPLEVTDLKASKIVVSGDLSVGGNLAVGGILNAHDLQLNGHIVTAGDAPKVSLEPAAGLSDILTAPDGSTLAKVSVKGNDVSGTITITAGDGVQSGSLLKLLFDKQYGDTPQIVLTPIGRAAAQLEAYVDSPSGDGFLLGTVGQPVVGNTYKFTYHILQ